MDKQRSDIKKQVNLKIKIVRGRKMNAVIYARYSCDNQREESIEGQIRECSQFAEKAA